MNHIKNLAGQTLIYGFSSLVPRFLSYLLNPVYTHNIDTSAYGSVSVLYAYIVFFNIILTYGMETGFFYYAKKEPDYRKVFGTAFYSVFSTTMLFVLVAFLNLSFLAKILQFSGNNRYLLWFVLIIGLDTISAIPFSKLRYQNKAFKFALIKIVSVCVNVVLNLIFIWIIPRFFQAPGTEADIEYIFIANFISSAVTILLLLKEIYIEKPLFDVKMLKKLLVYSLPLMVAGLAGSVNDIIDRILLKDFLPANVNADSEIGIYWANIKLAVIMMVFIQMFRFAAEPFFFNHNKGKERDIILADVTKYFIIYGLVIFLVITGFLDILKYYVGPEKYWPGLKIVPIYLLANLCLGIYFNLSFWFKFSGKTYYGIIITGIGALFTVIFNILLIPSMSYFGCSIIRLSSYLIMILISYFLGRKHLNIHYDLRNIFLYGFIALGIFSLCYYFPISNIWLNISKNTIALLLFLIYLEKREHIITIFKK